MILYFTGTGNSEYAAKKLAAALGEKTMPLMERIRHNDTSPLESETPWVVCTPTYAWQLPHIVRDHLRRTLLRGSKEIYFVMTCGGEIGEAGKYAAELCAEKYLTFRGCARVIMPENYIVMFDVPDEAKARDRCRGGSRARPSGGAHPREKAVPAAEGERCRQAQKRRREQSVLSAPRPRQAVHRE